MAKRRRRKSVQQQYQEYSGYKHHHYMKCGMFVIGLLILANAYWGILRWDYFIGLMFVLAGLAKMAMKKKEMMM